MSDYIFLALGIPAGIASNILYQYLRSFVSRRFDPIEMKGIWGEYMSEPGERQCSIGEIRYDLRRSMWVFDGTNYHNDGRPFCHWVTLASYFDKTKREFYYTFSNTLAETGQTGYIGFGVLRFRRHEGKWVPDRGFFISGNEGESYRSHSVVRLDRIPTTPQETQAVFRTRLGLPET
ncbi:hypothetical protein AB0K98_14955 [Streptomyces werraensis]|jgi:hypothetical protein|uniref:hypothetical protein n=1 Tax=Streptomyces TaxID=1883 RepID=UPI001CE2C139